MKPSSVFHSPQIAFFRKLKVFFDPNSFALFDLLVLGLGDVKQLPFGWN